MTLSSRWRSASASASRPFRHASPRAGLKISKSTEQIRMGTKGAVQDSMRPPKRSPIMAGPPNASSYALVARPCPLGGQHSALQTAISAPASATVRVRLVAVPLHEVGPQAVPAQGAGRAHLAAEVESPVWHGGDVDRGEQAGGAGGAHEAGCLMDRRGRASRRVWTRWPAGPSTTRRALRRQPGRMHHPRRTIRARATQATRRATATSP